MTKSILAILLVYCAAYSYAAPGETTANFLKLGIGARALGMGEAFSAVADDASAVYWNPAGLAQLGRQEAVLMHAEHVEEIHLEFLGYAFPLAPMRVVAARATYLSTGKIEAFGASGNPLARLPASYDLAFGGSYAQGFVFGAENPHLLFAGLGVNAIRKVVAGDLAFGPSFDLGVL